MNTFNKFFFIAIIIFSFSIKSLMAQEIPEGYELQTWSGVREDIGPNHIKCHAGSGVCCTFIVKSESISPDPGDAATPPQDAEFIYCREITVIENGNTVEIMWVPIN